MLSFRFEEFAKPDVPVGNAVASFRFYRDDEPQTVVRVVLAQAASADDVGLGDAVALESALLRYAVPRIEAIGVAGDVPDAYTGHATVLEIAEQELEELRRLRSTKTCRYQLRDDDAADLYCTAAGRHDETVIGSIGARRLAPTSQPLCDACEIPSTDFICSHLTHPEVIGMEAMSGIVARMAAGAFCEKGQPGATEAVKNCRAGGHSCWERIIAAPLATRGGGVSPLSLPEAIDFLDVVWRLRFGSRLLRGLPTSIVAGLALPVSSRDDFKARMSDVSAVFEGFQIAEELLGSGGGAGSLNRFEGALAAAGIDRSEEIRQLRTAQALRTALQHPDRARDMHQHFEALGLQYPPTDWAAAWTGVVQALVDAIGAVRDDIRSGTT